MNNQQAYAHSSASAYAATLVENGMDIQEAVGYSETHMSMLHVVIGTAKHDLDEGRYDSAIDAARQAADQAVATTKTHAHFLAFHAAAWLSQTWPKSK